MFLKRLYKNLGFSQNYVIAWSIITNYILLFFNI